MCRDTISAITGGVGFSYVLLVLAVVTLSYGASLGAPLIFDDLPNLVDNPLMHFNARLFDDWRAATLSGESGVLLRPVSMFSFALHSGLAGQLSPVALKAGNLLIHLACAGLVYRLAHALFLALGSSGAALPARQLALLAAAIWVLHPLHVSTVLYAVQRMAQLSTLFSLLGLVIYCHYRLKWLCRVPAAGEVWAMLLWCALVTCPAMLAKENGVLLPWLALVLEVTVFRGKLAGERRPALQCLAWMLVLLPVATAIALYIVSPATLTAGYGARDFTLQERLLTQVRILWHYSYWFFWPDIRNMGFQHDDIVLSRSLLAPWTTSVAALAWPILLGLAFAMRRRYPVVLLAALFFLVGHALESTIFPLEMAFEHRNYLPSVGLSLLLASVLGSGGVGSLRVRPRVLVAPALILLALLLALRCFVWSDPTRFTRVNATNHPHSVRAQFFYGDALYSQIGSTDRASVGGATDGMLLYGARKQFQTVNELAGGHSSALVMLYFADLFYLSAVEGKTDWLQLLTDSLLSTEQLTSSDSTAIEALANCAVSGLCEADRVRIFVLMTQLLERFPGDYRLLEQRYKLAAAQGLEQERLLMLEALGSAAQHTPALYSYQLSERVQARDTAGVYRALAQWMTRDRVRRFLPMQRQIAEFEISAGQSSAAPSGSQ